MNYPDSIYCTTIKYNSSGVQQWIANYDYEGYGSRGVALTLDKQGYIYVLSATQIGSSTHYATLKYSPSGVQQWAIISNDGVQPVAIALDSSYNIYVSGTDGNGHYLTIKYGQLVGIKPVSNLIPDKFSISNYPNPFNPTTLIRYDLPKSEKVTINLYNLLGQKIKTLINEYQEAGYYEIIFDGSKYASGLYIYKIIAGNFIKSKKLVILK